MTTPNDDGYDDDAEIEHYAAWGRQLAREEAGDPNYHNAEPRRTQKPYIEQHYDEQHEGFYMQRSRAVDANLDAYYAEWRVIQEERRAPQLRKAQMQQVNGRTWGEVEAQTLDIIDGGFSTGGAS